MDDIVLQTARFFYFLSSFVDNQQYLQDSREPRKENSRLQQSNVNCKRQRK